MENSLERTGRVGEITMATVRAYTTIEQSRKLAEILPLESSDMHSEAIEIDGDMVFVVVCGLGDKNKSNYGSPIWSLAALLNVLPKYEINNFGDTIQLGVNLEALATEGDETLLDLVVNMIIHLHELKML